MRSVRDMEREAARYAALTPEERREEDEALAAHRRDLGLYDDHGEEDDG